MRNNCCPPHVFKPDADGVDRCLFCFETWADLVRGFNSNVIRKRWGKK